MLILIEGIDGVGKTTLINLLSSYFETNNYLTYKVKYPHQKVKKFLGGFQPFNIFILYLDMFISLFNSVIFNSLGNLNYFVLMDRYWISSLCYQYGINIPLWIRKLIIKFYKHTLLNPDITIWLYINDLNTSLDRLSNRNSVPLSQFDSNMEKKDNLIKVNNSYCFYMPYIDNCYKINALQNPQIIFEEVLIIINKHLGN